MAALTGIGDLLTKLTDGTAQKSSFFMDNRIQGSAAVATIVGYYTSLWRYNKTNGGNGAVPTTVAAPTRTMTGALGQANPSGSTELWALGLEHLGFVPGALVMYDRLLHIGGLSGTTTSAQTVAGTLTRNTGGVGNEIWVEIYTQIGATGTTITASYTNQAGTTGRTTTATVFGATNAREESRIIRLPLADGDTGVQAVASVTVLATTGTAGNFGVTVARPLARGYIEGQGCAMFRDFVAGLPTSVKIDTDACIAFAWLAGSTTAPRGDIALNMVEK